MKAIRFIDVVKENGLILNSPELMTLFDREVEIIVLEKDISELKRTEMRVEADSKEIWNQSLVNLINAFDEDDINAFNEALEDCSQIYSENWK